MRELSVVDPFVVAADDVLRTALEDMRACTDGASIDCLNWRPDSPDTNSIAVLAVHSMHSTRSWLSIAVGAPLPPRDRPSEFLTTADDSSAFHAFIDEMGRDCLSLLEHAAVDDWSSARRTHPRPRPGTDDQVSAAWALVHAMEHLREHVGQMQLTRQLFDAGRH
jgi:uncharacterized damage-inducible protein DinB